MHAMHPGIVVNYTRPSATLPIATNIIIRGVLRQRDGVMNAVVEITDTNANKERVLEANRILAFPRGGTANADTLFAVAGTGSMLECFRVDFGETADPRPAAT